ncbi:MAG: TRAP transporter large permease subunit [Rhodobacteraceae bacterium]|nr:TRAP transporter large permease subunit [Paracoccaceae bacterium]
MEWYTTFAVVIAGLLGLMLLGLPVAFSFLLVNAVAAYLLLGGFVGVEQLISNTASALMSFTLVPIALFMIMGEVMFRSRIAIDLMDTVDKWIGRVRGRLAFMAVGGGVLFSTLTGNSMGSTALLGSALVPEMEKRGYAKPMSLGPILGSAGLAIMIPPSSLAVILGVIGRLSIAQILIAIILPGLLMAVIYAAYIWGRCWLQPHLAPSFDVPETPMREKLKATTVNILPLSVVVFSVVGLILLGIATPTEAAAMGAVTTLLLAAIRGRLSAKVFGESLFSASNISAMVLLIVAGAVGFSQLLSFTGATFGMVDFVMGQDVSPDMLILIMIGSVIVLGTFMGPLPIMLITLPIYIPVVIELGYNPVWFGVLFLIAIETGATSPPFGAALFVMKAVAPRNTTMGDIYRAAMPFVICDLLAIAIVFAFPQIVTWPLSLL